MSTKTTFKRIALVTVAALGFGVLTSVAPASAVVTNLTLTTTATQTVLQNTVATTSAVAGFTGAIGDSATLTAVVAVAPTLIDVAVVPKANVSDCVAADEGATERRPKPKAATVTSAIRLKVVFVDIYILSISRSPDDPRAGLGSKLFRISRKKLFHPVR